MDRVLIELQEGEVVLKYGETLENEYILRPGAESANFLGPPDGPQLPEYVVTIRCRKVNEQYPN